jgi:hypothetical protein
VGEKKQIRERKGGQGAGPDSVNRGLRQEKGTKIHLLDPGKGERSASFRSLGMEKFQKGAHLEEEVLCRPGNVRTAGRPL